MAVCVERLRYLPLTTSVLYLCTGLILGPMALGWIRFLPGEHARVLERLTEAVVLISLFSAGLKLRLPLHDKRWLVPLRLATISMVLTIGLVTLAGRYLMALPLGAAVLLGAILAPTDPVLASDVQVHSARDDDRLRFSLTGEAGLNDGSAFPFALLGLGLLGLHDLGPFGWHWFAADILWSVAGGIAVGVALGTLVGKSIIYLRREKQEAVGTDDFLALGLMTLTYGLAMQLHASGFLAVFAAGLALRHVERFIAEKEGTQAQVPDILPPDPEEAQKTLATHPEQAPAYMVRQILSFNEQLERAAELGTVVLLGGMLNTTVLHPQLWWFAPLLFLICRPLSILLGLVGVPGLSGVRLYLGWFGIRGIGSLFYLFYAINHGLPQELANQLTAITLSVVAISIIVHGLSVTPLMRYYEHGHK
jgi:NhaP-type Na+/H+ or K+/H+ antiporter